MWLLWSLSFEFPQQIQNQYNTSTAFQLSQYKLLSLSCAKSPAICTNSTKIPSQGSMKVDDCGNHLIDLVCIYYAPIGRGH